MIILPLHSVFHPSLLNLSESSLSPLSLAKAIKYMPAPPPGSERFVEMGRQAGLFVYTMPTTTSWGCYRRFCKKHWEVPLASLCLLLCFLPDSPQERYKISGWNFQLTPGLDLKGETGIQNVNLLRRKDIGCQREGWASYNSNSLALRFTHPWYLFFKGVTENDFLFL